MEKSDILPQSFQRGYGLENQRVHYAGLSFDEFETLDLSLLDDYLPSGFFYLVFSENVIRIIDRRKSLQKLVWDRYHIKIEEEVHMIREDFTDSKQYFMEGIGRMEKSEVSKTVKMLCGQLYTSSFLLVSNVLLTTKQLQEYILCHENHDIFSWRKVLGEHCIAKGFSFVDIFHGNDGLTINFLSPVE